MAMRLADGVRDAIAILQSREVDELAVNFGDTSPIEGNRLEFDQFLTALQDNSIIVTVHLSSGHFDQANDSRLERLFGQVLPSLASLTEIMFYHCRIAIEYFMMLAASLANREQPVWSLQRLQFTHTPIDQQGIASLSNSVLRANVPIEELTLICCGIDSAGCQALFQALDGNAHLRRLDLRYNNIHDISLTGVQALARSNLRTLILSNNLTAEAINALAKGLRANFSLFNLVLDHQFSLEDLHLHRQRSPLSSDLFEELLNKFNFTLQRLQIVYDDAEDPFQEEDQQELNSLIRLNDRVCSANDNLESTEYLLSQVSLWPDALSCISSKPSLLYRFVRQGNLNECSKQL